ncbi:M24 family metallopeptidase [Streptomyces tremellae]|uniref:Peptidase M24 domain-containing protein n=1 Tax=Streptomyces tremellae TaxID=1124239 RepID=A0ABP7DQ78_9ACTN
MAKATTRKAGARLDRLRARLDAAGLTALLLTSPGGRGYILGAEPGSAVLLTTEGTVAVTSGPYPGELGALLRAAGVTRGSVGTETGSREPALPLPGSPGLSLVDAGDLVFAELASHDPAELRAFAAAAELTAVGYTAVMDHLHVGMDVRELSGNVDRSVRRAGGLLGWYDPCGATGAAGSDLVTVRGHDPATARLTAADPVRYVLHPLCDGAVGYAAATAVLSRPDGPLRTAGDTCAAATAALLAALRPGDPLRDGLDAFARVAGEAPATCRIMAMHGGGASLPLACGSDLVAEPGMVLGVRTAAQVPEGGAVELAETVVVTGSGARAQARTPLRLVELH